MSRYLFRAASCGCLLAVAAAVAAQAQAPHTRRTTSAVHQLGLDDTTTARSVGRIRELKCRGKPGIDLLVDKDPSPRQPKLVAMVLRYERPKRTRALAQEGMGTVDYGVTVQHLPGSCSWNPGGLSGIPPEPGVVYFDLPRDAQVWRAPGARDTTINAAVHFPDVGSLARYLNDPERRWVFYVNELTNVAISFSAWPRGGALSMSTGSGVTHSPAPSRATSSGQPTTDSSTRTVPSPAGSRAGTLRGASPNRAASAPPAPASGSTIPLPGAGGGAAAPSRPVGNPAPSSSSPTSPGTRPTTGARADGASRLAEGIRNVTAAPGPLGVKLSFQIDGRVTVRVQFSKSPPQWDQQKGYWTYGDGWAAPWFAQLNHPFATSAYEAVPLSALETGTRYHYLISVVGTDGVPARQRTGAFTAAVAP